MNEYVVKGTIEFIEKTFKAKSIEDAEKQMEQWIWLNFIDYKYDNFQIDMIDEYVEG